MKPQSRQCILCAIVFLFVILVGTRATAQPNNFVVNEQIQIRVERSIQDELLQALDQLVEEIKKGAIDSEKLQPEFAGLIPSIWSFSNLDASNANSEYIIQLMKMYPLNNDQYMLSMAITGKSGTKGIGIHSLFDIIAERTNGEVEFSLPLAHKTKHWNMQKVGNITYYYRDQLSLERAQKFDEKNTEIAKKMSLKPESLKFFMCDNYQDFLNLVGINYSFEENGKYRDGYGVAGGCIFSIMDNEDFSHDIFHYYSGKVNERSDRNWITEEGVAYSWGNAYYTDAFGEMINQDRLVAELLEFVKENPKLNLLALFEKNQKPFFKAAPEASPRSLLSSLICDHVEDRYGMEGLQKLINCGSQDRMTKYLTSIKELLGITKENFNEKVMELARNY